MKRLIGTAFLMTLMIGLGLPLSALRAAADKPGASGDSKAAAVLDKAIAAIGGEDKLRSMKSGSWNLKGTITINGSDNDFTGTDTVCGLHQLRREFEGSFNGDKVKGVTVLDGDKGWRRMNDEVTEMDKDTAANEQRTLLLTVAAMDPLVLKAKAFKIESAAEEKVDDQPAEVIKVTGPDGKDFTMYFDKGTGLPVKQVAKIAGFDGQEFTQDATFSGYKEVDGVKIATKIQLKRNGEKFIEHDVTDFKASADEPAAGKFAEPK